MAQYTPGYMQSHCIDVFFQYGGRAIHVLTDGCGIPEELNDIERNRTLQQQTTISGSQIEARWNEVTINPPYLDLLRRDAVAGEYDLPEDSELLAMFAPMASLGYYTYDCISYDEHSALFVLVAKPLDGSRIEQNLPACSDSIRIEETEDEIILSFVWRY